MPECSRQNLLTTCMTAVQAALLHAAKGGSNCDGQKLPGMLMSPGMQA